MDVKKGEGTHFCTHFYLNDLVTLGFSGDDNPPQTFYNLHFKHQFEYYLPKLSGSRRVWHIWGCHIKNYVQFFYNTHNSQKI